MEDMDQVYADLMAYFDRAEATKGAFASNQAAYQWVIDRLNHDEVGYFNEGLSAARGSWMGLGFAKKERDPRLDAFIETFLRAWENRYGDAPFWRADD